MFCPACGTSLPQSARFCHHCGAPMKDAPGAAGWRAGLPWGLAGVAVGALLAALLLDGAAGGRSGAPAARTIPLGGTARPTDISAMSPAERANRLFDRVMRHVEANQPDSVQFFLPMAIQAHRMLPELDADARFHLGMLQLAGGDPAGALGQADSIQRTIATHLFGEILRARALEAQNDRPGVRRAYRAFLRNEAAERARQRPEYADHGATLDTFREEAARATGA